MISTQTKPHLEKRFLAGLIDYTIICSVTIILVYILGEPNNEGGYSISGLPALIPILFWLFITVISEITFGSTLGNSAVELKPIPMNGENRKLTFSESLKRHLLDPIDMFLFGLIGIITIKNTPFNQRVGDLWAKTIVVSKRDLNKGTNN